MISKIINSLFGIKDNSVSLIEENLSLRELNTILKEENNKYYDQILELNKKLMEEKRKYLDLHLAFKEEENNSKSDKKRFFKFEYTNYKGEIETRFTQDPILKWGTNSFYKKGEETWIIEAYDLERGKTLPFVFKNISDTNPK